MVKETIKDVSDKIDYIYQQLSAKLDQQMNGLRSEVTGVRTEVTNLSQVIEAVGSRIDRVEQKSLEIAKRCEELDGSIADAKTATFKELNEIEGKRHNLVFFGIPESVGSKEGSARDHDVKAIDTIVELLTTGKKPFELKFHIGKKQEKPRPILIRMRNMKDKEDILSKAHTLKEHPEWKKVFIKPDLTRNQRDFIQKLDEELASVAESRNAELKNGEDWKWAIRGQGAERHLAKVKSARV